MARVIAAVAFSEHIPEGKPWAGRYNIALDRAEVRSVPLGVVVGSESGQHDWGRDWDERARNIAQAINLVRSAARGAVRDEISERLKLIESTPAKRVRPPVTYRSWLAD